MQAFTELYRDLDATTRTSEKTETLARYFASAPPADAAWALYFLSGRKIRQVISTPKLREWALAATGLPEWLFGESYDAVGDFAETVALLLPEPDDEQQTMDDRVTLPSSVVQRPSSASISLATWVETRLLPLRNADEATQRAGLLAAWNELGSQERFIWNKLITGGFRVGVSQLLVTRALSQVSGVEQNAIAHRLMGEWQPTAAFYAQVLASETADANASQPYPFFLASPIEGDPAEQLGDVAQWQAEWKWDGIRAQLVRRNGQSFVWSRGEELVTERFPEIAAIGDSLPDGTVIDGEILPWTIEGVRPFAELQKRIGRKTLGKKLLADLPVILMAYDLLEWQGRDIRTEPLSWRRTQLEQLMEPEIVTTEEMKNTENQQGANVAGEFVSSEMPNPHTLLGEKRSSLRLSPLIVAADWEDLARLRDTSRTQFVEGLMLKRRDSPYRVGRVRGEWWKWKIAPYTIDAVLVTAQRGSGKRASLYSDYTFAVWNEDGKLVPFAKAYSGLTDAEIRQVDAFVRRNTLETFGPVRSVKPELVFELAFEGLQRSTRHKSGIAVRFPRMLRWRTDKKPEDADTLVQVRAMLEN